MDPNVQVLLISASVAVAAGLVVYVIRSQTIRQYGLFGAIRRRLSGGRAHSDYDG